VSHNATALRNLCSKGLLLENGTIVERGDIDNVLSAYVGSTSNVSTKIRPIDRAGIDAALVRVFVVPVGGALGQPIRGTVPFSIGIEVEVDRAGDIGVFLNCHSEDSRQMVFSTGTFFDENM